MNFTKPNHGAGPRRIALAALAALSLVPAASAGTYSAQVVGWNGTPTIVGTASASFSGLTASYTVNSANSAWKGSLQSGSQLMGTVRWKVTWSPSFVGDIAPGGCNVAIATQLDQEAHAETLNHQSNSGAYSADGWTRDAMGSFIEAQQYLPGGTIDDRYDDKGSGGPTHRANLLLYGSFSLDAGGNYVAYIDANVSGETFSSVTGGGVGRFPVNNCIAASSGYDAGALRLMIVNGVQIGNDFAGGSYPTSGYGN